MGRTQVDHLLQERKSCGVSLASLRGWIVTSRGVLALVTASAWLIGCDSRPSGRAQVEVLDVRGSDPAERWTMMTPPAPVILEYLREKEKNSEVSLERAVQYAFTQRAGWVRILYRLGSGEPTPTSLRLARGERGWRVVDELPPAWIAEAHLIEPPDPQGPALPVMEHLGAVAMERVLAEVAPGQSVQTFGVKRVLAGDVAAEFTATCVVAGRPEPIVRRYLLVRGADGWALDGELGPEERYDVLGHRVIRGR
jgi:hypothetical protein